MNLIPALDAETAQKPAAFPRMIVPAAAFGIVLGLAGLANAWRVAEGLWQIAPIASRSIAILAATIWALLLAAYACKWIFQREKALLEIEHPIQCCFVGLIGVSTMLIGGLCLPYFPAAAQTLFWLGALWTVVFAVWRTGGLWTGGREPTARALMWWRSSASRSAIRMSRGSRLAPASSPGWPSSPCC
jgi:tellurite resistance protein